MNSSLDGHLAGLSSKAPSERARAATWLLGHAQDISTSGLVQALQAETVPQVRRVLLEVLEAPTEGFAHNWTFPSEPCGASRRCGLRGDPGRRGRR